MCAPRNDKNRRILVIDDNRTIHDDVRKILGARRAHAAGLHEAEATLFGDTSANERGDGFEIDSAYQGQEGLEMVRRALRAERLVHQAAGVRLAT